MSDKHTALPWRAVGTAVYFNGGGFDVRNCPSPETLAAEIVSRYNNHAKLVEALRDCADSLDHDHRAQRELMSAEARTLLQQLGEME